MKKRLIIAQHNAFECWIFGTVFGVQLATANFSNSSILRSCHSLVIFWLRNQRVDQNGPWIAIWQSRRVVLLRQLISLRIQRQRSK
jgi:hypothetical protein